MKIVMIKDYRPSTGVTLEAGNTYDCDKQGLAQAEVDAMIAIGVCAEDGQEPVDAATAPKSVVLDVQSAAVGHRSTTA